MPKRPLRKWHFWAIWAEFLQKTLKAYNRPPRSVMNVEMSSAAKPCDAR
jgi:hypothetical protein